MPYEIPSDIEHRVKDRVDNGGYQTEDDVLRDALDALDERERDKLWRWHEGNRIAAEQSQQGLSKPLDLDAVLQRVEDRVVEQRKPRPVSKRLPV